MARGTAQHKDNLASIPLTFPYRHERPPVNGEKRRRNLLDMTGPFAWERNMPYRTVRGPNMRRAAVGIKKGIKERFGTREEEKTTEHACMKAEHKTTVVFA